MATDLQVYEAVRCELTGQLSEPAMAAIWTQPGGLDSLVAIYKEDTKLNELLRFVRCIS